MSKITVVSWVPYSSIVVETEDSYEHYQVLVDYLREHPEKHMSGYEHQYSDTGVPVFSDGSRLTLTMRGWGDLMKEVENNKHEWGYLRWAFKRPEFENYLFEKASS